METPNSSSWADEFLLIVGLVIALCAFVDWMLGETKRKQMRDRLGDYWLKLSYFSLRELVIENPSRSRVILEKIFYKQPLSFQRLLRVFVYSLVMTSIIGGYLVTASSLPSKYPGQGHVIGSYLVAMVFANFIVDYLAVYNTISIFDRVNGLAAPVTALIANFVVTLCLYLLFFILALALVGPMYVRSRPGLYMPFTFHFAAIGILIALIPVLASILYLVLIIALKIFRKVLQPVTMLILYRFQESSQGVLTTLSIGLGVAAKLIQQWLKA